MRFSYPRADLLAALQDNRAQHRAEFDDAWHGYCLEIAEQAACIARDSRALAKAAKAQQLTDDHPRGFDLRARRPASHDADYDRVERMLSMAAEDTVELDEQAFARYVCDQWDWRNDFDETRGYYVEKFGHRRGGRS